MLVVRVPRLTLARKLQRIFGANSTVRLGLAIHRLDLKRTDSSYYRCVWIYLFLLPFQLVNQFGWYTIPGVAVAAFFYIGFLAAGEEIEQPFGYDEVRFNLFFFEISP